MARNGHLIIPDAFDSLILDTILDGYESNTEIQKSIDMTANYVQSTNFNVAITATQENAFLQSAQTSKFLGFIGGKGLIYIIGAIITAVTILGIYDNFTRNNHNIIPLLINNSDEEAEKEKQSHITKIDLKPSTLNLDSISNNSITINDNSSIIITKSFNTHNSFSQASKNNSKTHNRNTSSSGYSSENKVSTKIRILGRNLPIMDYSMVHESNKKKSKFDYTDIPGFSFIPMGSFHYHGKTVSVQAFYAQETEVTNFQWMLFLNYLIDNRQEEKLYECIPNDKDWAYKMTYETDSMQASWNKAAKAYEVIPFSKKFKRANSLKSIRLTSFAAQPIVDISHKAAQLYAQWISEIYGGTIDFRIPTEVEWEWMAKNGNRRDSLSVYAWKGPFTRDSRGVYIANYTWPDSDIIFNKPIGVSHFEPNGYGLYDICGNAAEMVNNPNKTKGGSWASEKEALRISNSENWNAKPSNKIGFRLVRTYLGKGEKPKKNPPGTVWLKGNLYIDQTEVRNIDYMEYMYWTKRRYGKQSEEYNQILPDTTVWNTTLDTLYLRHPAYRDYPVVGVSYSQAVEYCLWRSDRVNEYIYFKNNNLVWNSDTIYKDIPQIYIYSLPSKEIFEEIASIKLTESTQKKIIKKGIPAYNYRHANVTDSMLLCGTPSNFLAPVDSYFPNALELFNLFGNVAEMTNIEGLAMGGSYTHTKQEIESGKDYSYTEAESWLGFRCVCREMSEGAAQLKKNKKKISSTTNCTPKDWLLVENDGLYGFTNSQGIEIVHIKYDAIYPFGKFQSCWARVVIEGLEGFIDSDGNEIVKPKYDAIYPFGKFQKNWARVVIEGLEGFIDLDGNEIVKPKYNIIHPFGEIKSGWAKVEIDGKTGFIDTEGNEVVKAKYNNIINNTE